MSLLQSGLKSQAGKLLQEEYTKTEGFGKILFVAAFFNIPIDGFIPYLSQIITVGVLVIFLKKYLLLIKNNTQKEELSNLSTVRGPQIIIALTVLIMLLQVVWIPFTTEIVTLVLIGLLYAIFTKYKK